MVSHTRKVSFYSFSPAGDSNLIEVTPRTEGLTLTIGKETFSFELDSALEIADALIEIASEANGTYDN
jgi:hypothetical protein